MKQKLLMTSATFYTDVSLAMSFCATIMREDTPVVRTRSRDNLSETVREAVAVAGTNAVREAVAYKVNYTYNPDANVTHCAPIIIIYI